MMVKLVKHPSLDFSPGHGHGHGHGHGIKLCTEPHVWASCSVFEIFFLSFSTPPPVRSLSQINKSLKIKTTMNWASSEPYWYIEISV